MCNKTQNYFIYFYFVVVFLFSNPFWNLFYIVLVVFPQNMSDVRFAEHCEKLVNIRLFVPCQIPPIKRCTRPLSSTY